MSTRRRLGEVVQLWLARRAEGAAAAWMAAAASAEVNSADQRGARMRVAVTAGPRALWTTPAV